MSIRVVVADDHEVVRSGIKCLLADSPIEIVAEAGSGAEAVQRTREHQPDVVLLDVRMPDGDGLEALETIHTELPETHIVILSTYDNPTYVARAVALGASDYVLKGSSREHLISVIVSAAGGESPPPDSFLGRVAGTMSEQGKRSDLDVPLTSREFQVLKHLALGLSNREIGRSLSISIETVKEHVQNVLRKIQAVDRTQAAVWAVRKGLV